MTEHVISADTYTKLITSVSERAGSVVLANIIAVLALLVAIYSLWQQRKNITVYINPNLEILNTSMVCFHGENNILAAPVIFRTYIEIVNPSPVDLAFFDLRAFNPITNINHYIVTRKTFPYDLTTTAISIKNDLNEFNQEIPDRNNGVLKANSFTHFDILIYEKDTDLLADNLYLAFKISKKNWIRKDPFAVTNRGKYEMYGTDFAISGWEEILSSQPSNQEY